MPNVYFNDFNRTNALLHLKYQNMNQTEVPQMKFANRQGSLNLNLIRNLDLNYVIKTNNITPLEKLCQNLIYSEIKDEDYEDTNIPKLLRTFQYALEYLNEKQSKLDQTNKKLEIEYNQLINQSYELEEKLKINKNEITKNNSEKKEKEMLLITYESIVNFNCDPVSNTNIIMNNINSNISTQNGINTYQIENMGKFFCHICNGKYFTTEQALEYHMKKRHLTQMKLKKKKEKEEQKEEKFEEIYDKKLEETKNYFENMIQQKNEIFSKTKFEDEINMIKRENNEKMKYFMQYTKDMSDDLKKYFMSQQEQNNKNIMTIFNSSFKKDKEKNETQKIVVENPEINKLITKIDDLINKEDTLRKQSEYIIPKNSQINQNTRPNPYKDNNIIKNVKENKSIKSTNIIITNIDNNNNNIDNNDNNIDNNNIDNKNIDNNNIDDNKDKIEIKNSVDIQKEKEKVETKNNISDNMKIDVEKNENEIKNIPVQNENEKQKINENEKIEEKKIEINREKKDNDNNNIIKKEEENKDIKKINDSKIQQEDINKKEDEKNIEKEEINPNNEKKINENQPEFTKTAENFDIKIHIEDKNKDNNQKEKDYNKTDPSAFNLLKQRRFLKGKGKITSESMLELDKFYQRFLDRDQPILEKKEPNIDDYSKMKVVIPEEKIEDSEINDKDTKECLKDKIDNLENMDVKDLLEVINTTRNNINEINAKNKWSQFYFDSVQKAIDMKLFEQEEKNLRDAYNERGELKRSRSSSKAKIVIKQVEDEFK